MADRSAQGMPPPPLMSDDTNTSSESSSFSSSFPHVPGETLFLPFYNESLWEKVRNSLLPFPKDLDELTKAMQAYIPGISQLRGLQAAIDGVGGGPACENFFTETLPDIIQSALKLQEVMKSCNIDRIPLLKDIKTTTSAVFKVVLPRVLVRSLMANMFLCTFQEQRGMEEPMPTCTFQVLLRNTSVQECAKLRMFIHYFERTKSGHVPGCVTIIRQKIYLDGMILENSNKPLLGISVAPAGVGFEDDDNGKDCLHADFANMYIGGGVLTGGCVQEEIRFSICPELIISCLTCSVLNLGEAIQILGAEQVGYFIKYSQESYKLLFQFSSYSGYGFGLRFAGPFVDNQRQADDGTILRGIFAMDAYDGRRRDFNIREAMMLREINKAAAGFSLMDDSVKQFSVLATGNWGCGVFGGFAPLKALLQWLASSHVGVCIRYFPYNEDFGPALQKLSATLTSRRCTVGDLWKGLGRLSKRMSLKGDGAVMERMGTSG
ncbi:hypothetical protein GUITHDRAFT_111887 [Guillardia theta CCMP2712]|uniref:poly(ADP-ribose) glycohydrolase n=1 Tax=Guillardia theta (strain CCMP2712) TaxID=905079 RepID=L1J129_GUITC|nr:hypothetical protein GUITHDRAFT_111887 [Guillardia theta CCMP2712]EKX42032.1 hypothetical protein GUITHDRAFT_111887 [Guillardia theta CCMP2712]|eukprot:XP_005829012.1 hypothetical protein GUITHDRAFT_111887 [Guillardia theta CCMP2712]